jgi:hypothetical protein
MSEEEETHVVPYVDVCFAELVVQAINSYEESKNNEFSRALNKLVEISKKHCSLLLDASVVKTEKISQSDYVMELLKTAIPNHERMIFNIETSNALFIYILEKFATLKAITPTRLFRMKDDWALIFKSTTHTSPPKPFTFNRSYVINEGYSNFVEFENAKVFYNVIKDTVHRFQDRHNQKIRRDNKKRKERELEDFFRCEHDSSLRSLDEYEVSTKEFAYTLFSFATN